MFDLKSFGDKIKKCRTNQEYSLEEVFEGTGIQAELITLYEEGKREPTGDEILILADFYLEDYRYFISNQQQSASDRTESLYRKFGKEFTKTDKRMIQRFLYLCECEQEVWTFLKKEHKKYTPPFLTTSNVKLQGKLTALDFRKFLKYRGNDLYVDIFNDLRKSGTHIFRVKLNNSNISGIFFNHPTAGKCILVNYSEDIYRQKFTVAHEFAHSIFDTNENYNISFVKDGNNLIEIRANYFASNLLVPTETLTHMKNMTLSEEIVLNLAKQFQVNVQVLLYRLKDEKLLSSHEEEKFKNIKIPVTEKLDPELKNSTEKIKTNKTLLLERGLSRSYILDCHEAYTKNYITKSRLAELFLVDQSELSKLLELYNLKLHYEL